MWDEIKKILTGSQWVLRYYSPRRTGPNVVKDIIFVLLCCDHVPGRLTVHEP